MQAHRGQAVAKKREKKRITAPGYGTRVHPASPLLEQLFYAFGQCRKVRCPHKALNDDALPVDQEAGRGCLHTAPGLGHRTGIVNDHIEGELSAFAVPDDRSRRVIGHCDCNRGKALPAVGIEQLHHLRHFCHAHTATGCPEVHQGHLACNRRSGAGAAIEQHHGGRGRLVGAQAEPETAGQHKGQREGD